MEGSLLELRGSGWIHWLCTIPPDSVPPLQVK
jgi:hypothetical protein